MGTVVSESSAVELPPQIKHAAARDIQDTHCLWSIHNMIHISLLLAFASSGSHQVFLVVLRVSLTEQAHGSDLILAVAEAPIPATDPLECG